MATFLEVGLPGNPSISKKLHFQVPDPMKTIFIFKCCPISSVISKPIQLPSAENASTASHKSLDM
jgi:hypothetical protein